MKRLALTTAAILFLVAGLTPAASAHQGNPNYSSDITLIRPAALADGIELSVKNFDDGLELVNRSGKVVVVIGYDGEPYLRFNPSGLVEVNVNSPSYYLNQDRYADVELPERADADAAPEWKQIDDTGVSYWHDHRSHYMGEGLPTQIADESVETKIFDYRIPMTVDGQPVAAIGSLTWVGSDDSVPILPFVGLALLTIVGGGWLVLRRRREPAEAGDAGETGGGKERPGSEAW